MLFLTTPLYAHKTVWVLIHGTFAKNAHWYRKGGDFHQALARAAGPESEVRSLSWSGENSFEAREKAAERLTQKIIQRYSPNDEINILGHSHGGNIAILVSQKLARQTPHYTIHQLITLAPPVELSMYSPNMNHIKSFYNFFSYGDMVQTVCLFFGRVFPNHPRVWNIQLMHDGRCPEHGNVHPKELAFTLPHLHKLVSQNNTPVLHLFSNKKPVVKEDERREQELQQDRRTMERLLVSIHYS